MSRGQPSRVTAIALLAATLATGVVGSGCGRRDEATSDARRAATGPNHPAPNGAITAAADSNLRESMEPIFFESREGGFEALFPSGCPRIVTRISPADAPPDRREIVSCFCDRSGRRNEGVAVTVHFRLRDEHGGPPTPRQVVAEVEKLMGSMRLQLVAQAMVRRGDLEGVAVRCRESGGPGGVWIEGLLLADKGYILSAWRPDDSLFTDPEIAAFFQSFRVTESHEP